MHLNIALDGSETDTQLLNISLCILAMRQVSTPEAAGVFGHQPLPGDARPLAPIAATSTAVVDPLPTAPAAPLVTSATTAPLPPTPPAPPAPTAAAPVVAPTLPANAVVDVRGFPWDERIHSGNHGKNKDGTWRFRRFGDLSEAAKAKLILQVEAELAPSMLAEGVPVSAPVAAPLPPVPPAPPIVAAANAMLSNLVPTFAELIQRVQAALTSNQLTGLAMTEKLAAIGLSGLHEANNRPDVILQVIHALGV